MSERGGENELHLLHCCVNNKTVSNNLQNKHATEKNPHGSIQQQLNFQYSLKSSQTEYIYTCVTISSDCIMPLDLVTFLREVDVFIK